MFHNHRNVKLILIVSCPLMAFWNIVSTNILFPTRRATSCGILRSACQTGIPFEPTTPHKVHFLETGQLVDIQDYYSGAWLLPIQNFMQINLNEIQTLEGATFAVVNQNPDATRMTLDWLDFSVEHMSKWWKVARLLDDASTLPFNRTVNSFQSYARNSANHTRVESPLKSTLAIVAFQPIRDKRGRNPERSKSLTVSSLAATMASLIKVGFGRIVVVGLTETDRELVGETFRFLRDSLHADETSLNDTDRISQIGQTEVAYVQARLEECKTNVVDIHIPRAAIYILRQALSGDLDPVRRRHVLGTTNENLLNWKYFYFTEQDLILNTKPSSLPSIKNALEEGLNIFPHRLQPLPHEADLVGMSSDGFFLSAEGNYSKVLNLDAMAGAVCCDEQMRDYKPYQDNIHPRCGHLWWACGFSTNKNGWRNHNHLKFYSLVRLTQGTGIVNLAATGHGRRCFPKTRGACKPFTRGVSVDTKYC